MSPSPKLDVVITSSSEQHRTGGSLARPNCSEPPSPSSLRRIPSTFFALHTGRQSVHAPCMTAARPFPYGLIQAAVPYILFCGLLAHFSDFYKNSAGCREDRQPDTSQTNTHSSTHLPPNLRNPVNRPSATTNTAQ